MDQYSWLSTFRVLSLELRIQLAPISLMGSKGKKISEQRIC